MQIFLWCLVAIGIALFLGSAGWLYVQTSEVSRRARAHVGFGLIVGLFLLGGGLIAIGLQQ